jgi:hypothetical protein
MQFKNYAEVPKNISEEIMAKFTGKDSESVAV